MNPLTLNPVPLLIIALVLVLSIGGNMVQFFSARTAAAECVAAAATVKTTIANADADAQADRADQQAQLATDANTDQATRLAALERVAARIERGAQRYTTAATAQPLAPDCRASGDRVQAVNQQRGYDE